MPAGAFNNVAQINQNTPYKNQTIQNKVGKERGRVEGGGGSNLVYNEKSKNSDRAIGSDPIRRKSEKCLRGRGGRLGWGCSGIVFVWRVGKGNPNFSFFLPLSQYWYIQTTISTQPRDTRLYRALAKALYCFLLVNAVTCLLRSVTFCVVLKLTYDGTEMAENIGKIDEMSRKLLCLFLFFCFFCLDWISQ